MPANSNSTFLLASPEPALLAAMEPLLTAEGARVEIALTADAALAVLGAPVPPAMVLLDTCLPGMAMGQLLAAVSMEEEGKRCPIVLISDTVTQEWLDRLAEGVIDDLAPRSIEPAFLRLRLQAVLRSRKMAHELEMMREAAAVDALMDRLTGVYNRETLLSMLFRETDRVQRMKSSLCVILFDIDDFGHWNSRLGNEACDDLLRQVATRSTRLLRSYDLLGRPGKDEFLMGLPGCSSMSAAMLAERLRSEVFCTPFNIVGEVVRLSACFGIAQSHGRSPVVVLREAEQALEWAKAAGPESIQCFGEDPHPETTPVTFLSGTSGDELLAW